MSKTTLLQKLGLRPSSEENRMAARIAAHVQDGDEEDEPQAADGAEGDEEDDADAKAADDDEGEDPQAAEGEDGDDGDDDAEAADDDEDDEEPKAMAAETEDGQAARRRERARITDIVRSPSAAGREATALALALDTDMTAAEAETVLATTPKSGRGRLAAAMSDVKPPAVGPGGGPSNDDDPGAMAARIAGYVNAPPARH